MNYNDKRLDFVEHNLKRMFQEPNEFLQVLFAVVADLRVAREVARQARALVTTQAKSQAAQAVDGAIAAWTTEADSEKPAPAAQPKSAPAPRKPAPENSRTQSRARAR